MECKERLQRGQRVQGIMLSELYTPNIARLIGVCGADFLLVDCEHGYFDMTQVAHLAAAAEAAHLTLIVRIDPGDRHHIGRYLDMGVRGIMMANAEDSQQIRDLVARCLYAPRGDRGVSTMRAHAAYTRGDLGEIMEGANCRTLVMAQVESPGAVERAGEMAAVEGLDGLVVGPNDLSQRMDLRGQPEAPAMLDSLTRVADAARQQGKWSGIITEREGLLRHGAAVGMRFFSTGSELSLLAAACRQRMEQTRRMTGGGEAEA